MRFHRNYFWQAGTPAFRNWEAQSADCVIISSPSTVPSAWREENSQRGKRKRWREKGREERKLKRFRLRVENKEEEKRWKGWGGRKMSRTKEKCETMSGWRVKRKMTEKRPQKNASKNINEPHCCSFVPLSKNNIWAVCKSWEPQTESIETH